MKTYEQAIQWLVNADDNSWVSSFDETGTGASDCALLVAFLYDKDILDVHAALLVALHAQGRL